MRIRISFVVLFALFAANLCVLCGETSSPLMTHLLQGLAQDIFQRKRVVLEHVTDGFFDLGFFIT
jgi:hypothetical protein